MSFADLSPPGNNASLVRTPEPSNRVIPMPHAPLRLSEQAQRTTEQPISHFMKQAIETPGLISLAAGLVDEPSLPTAEIAQAVAEVFADPATAKAALQYGTTQGLAALRQAILARYAHAGNPRSGRWDRKALETLADLGSAGENGSVGIIAIAFAATEAITIAVQFRR